MRRGGSDADDPPFKGRWAKAWRAMIEVAPVRLIRDDPVYEVLPAHLKVLTARGFTYEVLPVRPRRAEKRRHGTAEVLGQLL